MREPQRQGAWANWLPSTSFRVLTRRWKTCCRSGRRSWSQGSPWPANARRGEFRRFDGIAPRRRREESAGEMRPELRRMNAAEDCAEITHHAQGMKTCLSLRARRAVSHQNNARENDHDARPTQPAHTPGPSGRGNFGLGLGYAACEEIGRAHV